MKQTRAKQERVIEAVRRGLEGDAAVEFVHKCGYAMTSAGIARHLRGMGGRGRVRDLIDEGKTNIEILALCFPDEDLDYLDEPPSQAELFSADFDEPVSNRVNLGVAALFESRKLAIKLPSDLYEALRLAAKAEHKSQNQLIVDILTSALSRLPRIDQQQFEDFEE